MRFILFLGMLAFMISTAHGDVLGRWKTGKNDKGAYGIIKFYKCGVKYCGRLVGGGGKNVDKSMFGIIIVKDMKKKGRRYSGGEVFAADRNTWFLSKMHHISTNRLKVSGCVLGRLICLGQTWVRQ